jgi:hypothetical protein
MLDRLIVIDRRGGGERFARAMKPDRWSAPLGSQEASASMRCAWVGRRRGGCPGLKHRSHRSRPVAAGVRRSTAKQNKWEAGAWRRRRGVTRVPVG